MICNATKFAAILPLTSAVLLAIAAGIPVAQTASATSNAAGAAVYRRQCASCHGEKGEGSKRYKPALTGTKSREELAKFIAKSMPPGPVSKRCTAANAKLVAPYIFDAFYSPLAQERNRPARISLSRLTVRQYRNTVTDLIGSFRDPANSDNPHGLSAEYFKIGRPDGGQRVLQRVDPEVHFDYGTAVPVPADNDPYQFAMVWQGSIIAPDTGDYDFIVRTEHAAQLWVNSAKTPIIDAMVKSGDRSEYHASLYLVGGRNYPIKLEFEKGVTGVDNLEKVKKKPPMHAAISLEWQRPKQAVEVIPPECLLSKVDPQVYVPSTPFPPDDRSIGYERGSSVTRAWDDAATASALDTATYVTAHLRELSGAADDAKDRELKLRQFCAKFVERAFRRPLTPDIQSMYIDKQFVPGRDLALAVKRVVVLTLMSPRFLYTEPDTGPKDAYDTASRLSFDLWDSAPDNELLKAAASGSLITADQVRAQADRMVTDPRAWSKLREFFMEWLKIDQYPDLVKDPKLYPEFDKSVATDLRTSLDLSLKEIAVGDKSDYRDLFLSDKLFLNGRLSKIYGGGLAPDSDFKLVSLKPGERFGILTHPYIMSSFAYFKSSDPIHRGVLIYRNLLGRILNPPPAAFVPLAAELHPDLTTRERVSLQTKPQFCNNCHGKINPLGFTLEKYDAIGRVRDTDNNKPVNCSGSYTALSGKTVSFANADDLANYIANSPEAHRAFVEKLFQHTVKQPIRAFGPSELTELQHYFETQECSIRKLMVEIATQSALKR